MKNPKSLCPQNLALEVIGDKWTLLIIRDMMLEGKRYFREFLQSRERIASNILSNRLRSLEEEEIIYSAADPDHKQKIQYFLTQKGIDLFPILIANARWSLKYKPVDKDDAKKAQKLLDAGQGGMVSFTDNLKVIHLKHKQSPGHK